MKKNKKARSDAATSEQAKESSFAGSLQHNKDNTKSNRIQDFLLEGEINALPMRELARLAGVSERYLRKIIERERGAGAFILSSEKGYYLPSRDNPYFELRRYMHREDARMCSNRKAVRAVKFALKELEAISDGQTKIEL